MDLEDLAASSGPIPADFDASNAPNDAAMEMQFAVMCMEHAEEYWNSLTTGGNPGKIEFTKHDEEIRNAFSELFPEYHDIQRLRVIDENDLKSVEGKTRWRNFIKVFEKQVEDFNFGSLLRRNSDEGYTEKNSMFAIRLQFYAIELARNKAGLNLNLKS